MKLVMSKYKIVLNNYLNNYMILMCLPFCGKNFLKNKKKPNYNIGNFAFICRCCIATEFFLIKFKCHLAIVTALGSLFFSQMCKLVLKNTLEK